MYILQKLYAAKNIYVIYRYIVYVYFIYAYTYIYIHIYKRPHGRLYTDDCTDGRIK